jgi:hypothetical protein
VDISKHPENSADFVLESELLTINGIKRAVHHALKLSQRMEIRQIHCSRRHL